MAEKINYARIYDVNVAVDVALFGLIDGKLHTLLIQPTKKELQNKWAIPGGLVKKGSGLEEQALEILESKTGVKHVLLDQLATFGKPDRDPFGHVISVAYIALVNIAEHVLKTTYQNADVQWFSVDKMPKLAYDHAEIMKVALRRLRGKVTYTNIIQGMLPAQFTLSDFQNVYELIMEEEMDKRNFRKKVLALDMLEETGEKQEGTKNRPAKLYRFTHTEIQEYFIV